MENQNWAIAPSNQQVQPYQARANNNMMAQNESSAWISNRQLDIESSDKSFMSMTNFQGQLIHANMEGHGKSLVASSIGMVKRNGDILDETFGSINKIQKAVIERIFHQTDLTVQEKKEEIELVGTLTVSVIKTCEQQLEMNHGNFEREREQIIKSIETYRIQCFAVIEDSRIARKNYNQDRIDEREKIQNQDMKLVSFIAEQKRIQAEFDVKQDEYVVRYNQELKLAGINDQHIKENENKANDFIREQKINEQEMAKEKLCAKLKNIQNDKERAGVRAASEQELKGVMLQMDARHLHELNRLNIECAKEKGQYDHAAKMAEIGNQLELERINANEKIEQAKIKADEEGNRLKAEANRPPAPQQQVKPVVVKRGNCAIM